MSENREYQSFFPTDPDYGKNERGLVAVVGHGFVGKAVEKAMLPEVNRFIVDPIYNTDIDQLVEQEPSLSFVCVPTPVQDNGRIDAAAAYDAILKLLRKTQSAVVLKSTVTPDVIDKLCRTIEADGYTHRFIYAPEFLQERNAENDYLHPDYMVFGGLPDSIRELIYFYDFNTHVMLPSPDSIHSVTPVEASFIKYAVNSYLAMKVTFFNQLYDAVEDEKLTCSPLSVLRTVAKEPRIGISHWRVPGSDGKRGFGGACFPKDVSALLGYTDKLSILEKVMEVNNIYRKGYDLDEREKLANVHFLTEKKETLTVDDVIDDDQLDLFGEQS